MCSRRIIVVLPDPPLPFGSAAARGFYVLLRGLHSRGHRVTTYTSCTDKVSEDRVRTLFPESEYDIRCFDSERSSGLLSKWKSFRQPYSFVFGPALQADLAKTLREPFDVLHLETHWTGRLAVRHAKKSILNVHSLYSIDLPQSGTSLTEQVMRNRVIASEKQVLRSFPRICALTPPLARHIQKINPRATVDIAPLGFDTQLYRFEARAIDRHCPTIGLIGNFRWHPTYTAGRRLITRLWPKIKQRIPASSLLIVGRHARAMMGCFTEIANPNITLLEDVPDASEYFRKLDVMIYVPEVGSGMKVKILEAFALGVPVITNRNGSEGLPIEHGRHAMLSDDDDAIADLAKTLLDTPDHCIEMVHNARRLVEETCASEVLVRCFEAIYDTIAA